MALTLDGFLPHEDEMLMRWVRENGNSNGSMPDMSGNGAPDMNGNSSGDMPSMGGNSSNNGGNMPNMNNGSSNGSAPQMNNRM